MSTNRQDKMRLGPTPHERIRALFLVGHSARMLALRRVVAVVFILFAGLLTLQPGAGQATEQTSVLVAARDLAPGHVLTRGDVVIRQMPRELLPHGAFREPSAVEGQVLSGASRTGEPLTDVRLAGRELSGAATDDKQAAVPVRLADPAVADFLRPGQLVDIITADPDSGPTSVLAERAPVIAVRPTGKQHEQNRLIVVRLPRQQAATVAAAALARSVTVTLR